MPNLPVLLHDGEQLASFTAAAGALCVLPVVAVAVFARNPRRRRDARETLAILLRRRDR
ncbi:hypothetical protein [Kitasatospora aureofaciens]|uniref:hypothetical protein n=1 Tax=Kitasatospora aureofaciens TaxID=1894 RepID=UPI000A8943DD|nr:hypothetical protein [Kitasatospora aureofaciens]